MMENAAAQETDEASVVHSLSPTRRRFIFVSIYVGAFITCISQSMIITALPTIMHQFSITAGMGQLLTTAYIFVLGLFSATTAFLISRFNSKYLFLFSIGFFALGCIGTVFAPTYELLLASRLVQATGAGVSLPLIQVVALLIYPKERYGYAMGLVGLIVGVAPAVGPAISGVIVDVWCWQGIFIILAVLALVIFVISIFAQKNVTVQHDVHLDIPSIILFYISLSALLVAVALFESASSMGLVIAVVGAAALILLTLFVRRQLRIPEPFLHLRHFKLTTFAVATILVVLSQSAMMGGSIMVPLFVQDVQGYNAAISGLTITPGAILLGIFNPITGKLMDTFGPRFVALTGFIILIVGTVAFLPCTADTPPWVITLLYGFRTIGIACLMMPLTGFACSEVPQSELSQATAIITAMRQMFSALIVSMLVTLMSVLATSPLGVDDFGFDISFGVQALFYLVGFILAIKFLPKRH